MDNADTAAHKGHDGVLHLVDLAGSERNADTAAHSRERLRESKLINQSLMVLKECLRARETATRVDRHVHVPFRRSRLTLFLKDIFDLEVRRATKTLVIATLSPGVCDFAHSLNTVRYAAPIRVTMAKAQVRAADPKDPSEWDHDRIAQWARDQRVDPAVLCPDGTTGKELLELPSRIFLRRCIECGLPEKRAQMVYERLWGALVDARTRERARRLEKQTRRKARREADATHLAEMVATGE